LSVQQSVVWMTITLALYDIRATIWPTDSGAVKIITAVVNTDPATSWTHPFVFAMTMAETLTLPEWEYMGVVRIWNWTTKRSTYSKFIINCQNTPNGSI
jgi:hypothetical protein